MLKDVNERVRLLNDAPARPGADYVLYWAQINRRLDSNHGLAFAVQTANQLGLPVLVYEGLTYSHPWASERFHNFILDGVPDNAARAAELGLGYSFYFRRSSAAGMYVASASGCGCHAVSGSANNHGSPRSPV